MSSSTDQCVFFNEPIAKWIDLIHTKLSEQYQMNKIRLTSKKYGYESYGAVLVAILSNITTDDIMLHMRGQSDRAKYVELAHDAWCQVYVKWKCQDMVADNPRKSVNTHRRNDRATTQAKYLSSDDLVLYHDIITLVFDTLTKNILIAGLANISL